MLELNYFAVGAGTVIMTVLGALWYGPLFTKPWLVAMGKSMEEIQAQGGMAGALRPQLCRRAGRLLCTSAGYQRFRCGHHHRRGAHRRAAVSGPCRHQQPGRRVVRGARGNPLLAQ